jgi:hypothetical protein
MAPAIAPLPRLSLLPGTRREDIDAGKIVDDWLSNFQQLLENKGYTSIAADLAGETLWRDLCARSWTITTKVGPQNITEYLQVSDADLGGLQAVRRGALVPQLADMGPATWIQSGISFETKHGEGKGLVRLFNAAPGRWKPWIIFTKLDHMKILEGSITKPLVSALKRLSDVPQTRDLQVLVIGAGRIPEKCFLRWPLLPSVSRHRSLWTFGSRLSEKAGTQLPLGRSKLSARLLVAK